MCSLGPGRWRYTWEGQSHSPNLKLFIFNSHIKPSDNCLHIRASLLLSKSLLTVTWTSVVESPVDAGKVSLDIPLPSVLIDPEAPVVSRALDDHVEVKLLLLLPVDHPLIQSEFSPDGVSNDCASRDKLPLTNYAFELKNLNSERDGVYFYCKACSGKLTRSSIGRFVEMPSVNWQELADNWFGGCCGSFGGASEKLVRRFVDSYACVRGVGYLTSSAVTLCSDDVVGFQTGDVDRDDHRKEDAVDVGAEKCINTQIRCDNESPTTNMIDGKMRLLSLDQQKNRNKTEELENLPTETAMNSECCDCHLGHDFDDSDQYMSLSNLKEDKRSLRDGYLGDGFISRSQNLSADIEWKPFTCPDCSAFLGVSPCTSDGILIDKGVRLYKCTVVTSSEIGGPNDHHFREYSLERMFSSELIDKEKDELSFRTLLRDLKTKSPILRLVVLNSSSWSCTGVCSDAAASEKAVLTSKLQPIVKVLFSGCGDSGETRTRDVSDWETKHRPDELFMMKHMIEQLLKSLEASEEFLPASCKAIQGFSVSSLPR